jgi:F-type H+-transporting ATPase subunit a
MADDPFEAGHLVGHVKDSPYFEVPRVIEADGHLDIPQGYFTDEPLIAANQALHLEALDFTLTKFMVLEFVVAVVVAIVFIALANRMAAGNRPRGRIWNLLEAMIVYIRDEVARPAIGHHDADRFLPFLWTLFFFILGCNLMGMLPWAGSPTGALGVTGALAIIALVAVMGAGMAKLGPVGFFKAQVPHMELPFVLAIFLVPMIFVIEIAGLFIKHLILAMRLLANMFAGHLVLAVILGFIAASAGSSLHYGVAGVSVLGATALSMLELFVAFLQAYIFTFLTALFIGMAVHPH